MAVQEKTSNPDDTPRARRSRMEEEFALLMTACVNVVHAPPQELEAPSVRPQPTVGRAAEIWRRVDGGVTESATTPPANARFMTEIVHPELGPMAVAVERRDDTVRVVFEVADAVAKVAVETQRTQLLQALYTAGVKVASVVVVVRSGGTAFAHRSPQAKTRRSDEPSGPEEGLDLVG